MKSASGSGPGVMRHDARVLEPRNLVAVLQMARPPWLPRGSNRHTRLTTCGSVR